MGKKPLNEKQVKTLRNWLRINLFIPFFWILDVIWCFVHPIFWNWKSQMSWMNRELQKLRWRSNRRKLERPLSQFLWVRTPSKSSRNISQNDSSRISSSQVRWVTSQGNQLPLNNMPRSLRIGWGHWVLRMWVSTQLTQFGNPNQLWFIIRLKMWMQSGGC